MNREGLSLSDVTVTTMEMCCFVVLIRRNLVLCRHICLEVSLEGNFVNLQDVLQRLQI